MQAEIEETYSLASGQTASTEPRRHDILVFREPPPVNVNVPRACPEGALCARFPITPSLSYETADLTSGVVHLDILAGREAVRGKTGGRAPVVVENGAARLSVPGMAMPEDTAVSVKAEELSSFLPTTGVEALAEVLVDLSGKSLGLGAELSVETSLATPADTVVLAKVERLQGIPYVTVVALGQVVGDRVVSHAYAGLPGIVTEGRYVFFRLTGLVGFVSGTATAAGAPVEALVETDGLPFVGLADAQGRFQVAAAPGSAALEATVPLTSLRGSATVEVLAPEPASVPRTVSQDVVLTGTVTTATVRPQDGSPAVATNTPIEIESSAPLNAAIATSGNVRLVTADGAIVATRLVLSASRKVLALVPDAALLPSTLYRIEATGLADTFGGLVSVPTTSFTTKADVAPVYDVAKLVFNLPDADGNVSLTAPAGTLAPGTEILVINATSGFVATFTAENDGAVGVVLPASFPATISDKLFVTITDPLGNVTSFTRSQYEDPATGRTAIGPGGGTVEAADESGAELRIPEGALANGVTLKLTSFTLEDLPEDQRQTPDFPEANFGSGLKIESADKPSLKKEAKLAFPLPQGLPANPQDAFFYVFRRLEGPDGKVAFETIDHAFIEGEGASAKVVTASWPQAGYENSYGAFTASFGAVGVETNYVQLMWTYNNLLPGKAVSGVITGQVRRAKWNPGSETPGFEVVPDVIVSEGEIDGSGNCRPRIGTANNLTAAVSQDDGTYTLIDPHYAGGTVTIAAVAGGEARCATAYEVQRASTNLDPRVQALLAGSRYDQIATANISFPAVSPAEAPGEIEIQVLKVENGERKPVGGMVTQGTPLVLRLTASSAGNLTATLQGVPCNAEVKGPSEAIVDLESDPKCRITDPGTYTVVGQGVATFGGVVTASKSFLVVAPGRGNNEPLPDSAPAVIAVAPTDKTRGAPVNAFPQVTFSEPVRVAGAARLKEEGDALAVRLLGVTTNGDVVDLAQDAGAPITSLTMVPSTELKYGTTYTIELGQGIEDLDQPPKALQPLTSTFETFTPSGIASTQETFGSPGMVLLGNRAYLVQANFYNGYLKVFDVTDPTAPAAMPQDPQGSVVNRPVDLAGEGTTIVVATGSTASPKPSNLYVFDVSDPNATRWVGAASVTPSAASGHVTRLQMRGGRLYAATYKQGIQVIDLDAVRSIFAAPGLGPVYPPAYHSMASDLSTDGKGFGVEAAVRLSIPVKNAAGRDAYLKDIEVDDLPVDGLAQPLVLATGDVPFVVVNPQGAIAYDAVEISSPEGRLASGEALASGRLGNRQVAVVAGIGVTPRGSVPMLAVINLTDPRNPTTLGTLELPLQATTGFSITDVVLKGSVALIGLQEADLTQALGRVLTVNLGDGTRPVYAGAVNGIGGRLAVGEGNVLFGTSRSVFGTGGPLGGLHVFTLGSIVILLDKDRKPLSKIELPKNTEVLVRAIVPGAAATLNVEASITGKDGNVRTPGASGIPTQRGLPLALDEVTGYYDGRLRIVDKDCGITLNQWGDEVLKACPGDLEAGPWSVLRIVLPPAQQSLERVVDIRPFRLVTLGDSLTQGVQHVVVVHHDQRYSYPAQVAAQINLTLASQYGQQTKFVQALIEEPGSPPLSALGHPYGNGNGSGIVKRMNPDVQPVNNLGLSGAQTFDLYTAKQGAYELYDSDGSFVCTPDGAYCNRDMSKHVWPLVLGGLANGVHAEGTALESAAKLDPSLVIAFPGSNHALGAARHCQPKELTDPEEFKRQYTRFLSELRTSTRADVVPGTVPDVETIPHMLTLGNMVGDLPFKIDRPLGGAVTDNLEKTVLSMKLPGATTLHPAGTKTGLTNLAKKLTPGSVLLQLLRVKPRVIQLKPSEGLDPKELAEFRTTIAAYNEFIREQAAEYGFLVVDANALLNARLQDPNSSTRLNTLFTGTLRPETNPSEVRKGKGNTLFSWDGIHPNSAGYALLANELIATINRQLQGREFGGLPARPAAGTNDVLPSIPPSRIKELLLKYLALDRLRIQSDITNVE